MINIQTGVACACLALASFNLSAIPIASSLVEDNGEWSTGNTFNQWLGPLPVAGLSPTAGSKLMHFNSALNTFSDPTDISFASVLIGAGNYTVTLDVGSFTNSPLATIDTIGMTANGALLSAASSVTPTPARGTWRTWAFDYVVPSGSGLIGDTLGFTIDVATNGLNANIAFDNLNIDYDAIEVPEPAVVWLFAFGLLGLFGTAKFR